MNTLLQIDISIHSVANSRTLQQHAPKLTLNIYDWLQVRPFHKEIAKLRHKHDVRTRSLRSSVRLDLTMSTATANDSDDDFRSRGQQPVLASQRAKQNNTPTEANRTGKVGGYFPLGYKDAISQWVSNEPSALSACQADSSFSGQTFQPPQPNTRSYLIYPTSRSPLPRPRQGQSPPPKRLQRPPSQLLTTPKVPQRGRLRTLILMVLGSGIRSW